MTLNSRQIKGETKQVGERLQTFSFFSVRFQKICLSRCLFKEC